ncbi:unnamed protein product [Linum trigynum]|uniref:Uncharacterized protein n=1 Tax=Linum trigynum TaxID=586398 RepID=A0AAV2DBN8_9ROSI
MQTHQPVTARIGINSFFSLQTTVIPPFFGTIWVGLAHLLSDIAKMILASISFTISARTTASKFGVNLRCSCLNGLTSSSIRILWEHKDGLMPLMSVIFHAMALSYFCSRATSLLFC